MTAREYRLLRHSLATLWLATAAVSLWGIHGQSRALLVSGGVGSPAMADALVIAGAALDAVLGLLLLFWPVRWVYAAALVGMLAMTLVASCLLPDLWLHPLGPLSKNMPLAAMLWVLWKAEK